MRNILIPIALIALMFGFAFLTSGCAPLVIGGVVGYEVSQHREWCWRHYGNPYCDRRFPMGVHR